MKLVRAAIVGINEISGAVVAMTLTLAAVYAPVAFSAGRTGKLFTEFALTLAGAVLVSGTVAVRAGGRAGRPVRRLAGGAGAGGRTGGHDQHDRGIGRAHV